MYEEVWHLYLFVYDIIFLMWMTSKNSVSFENAFFNCLGCCNKKREFVFADINMFWARLRLNFTWAARRGLKLSLRRAQNISMNENISSIIITSEDIKLKKWRSFPLFLGEPNSMIRAIAQIDVEIYGVAFYPLISYCILSISSATRPTLCPFYHFEIHFTVPNSLC